MTWQYVLYSVNSGVAHVVLNRPEKLNALGMGPGSNRVELTEALEQADGDPDVGSILVSAAGRAFCAGGDMTGVPRIQSPMDNKRFVDELDATLARVRRIRKPIVAAAHGLVLGSGMGLTALFDFVIAAEGTRFGLIEGRVGHPGATEIVPLVGAAWAKYLMLTGEIIDARRAAAIGLVLEVEQPDELLVRCTDLAERLARMPREAVMLNKASIDAMLEVAGRGAGRSVGRLHDVLTRSMTHAAAAPDGRKFEEILASEGMQALKAARDTQYGQPWLKPLAPAAPTTGAKPAERNDMAGALDGLRVVDMTSVVMGPTATQLLGDHGAEVIKVEAASGDTTRQVTPLKHEGMGYAYLQKNRNKRSIVLDLKQAEHFAALEKLLQTADIFIYSVRPKAMARMGLTPERFAELNPGLISVSLVGYGEGGPYTGRPAYEDLIQGLTAIPSLLARTGSPQPQYVPVSFNDRAVGVYAAAMMMIALNHRNRTGEGQHIEVPMFETMAQFVIGDHMGGMAFIPPIAPPGYLRTLTPERRPYKTKDGYICVIVYTDSQWRAFGKLIGRPGLLDEDDRFRSLGTRTTHAEAVYALVRQEMVTGTTDQWLEKLNAADIPATPLHTLESIFDDPHLKATGFFEEFDHPTEGKLLMTRGPKNWSKTPPQVRRPAPLLGENTAEILTELGYSEEEARKIAESTKPAG